MKEKEKVMASDGDIFIHGPALCGGLPPISLLARHPPSPPFLIKCSLSLSRETVIDVESLVGVASNGLPISSDSKGIYHLNVLVPNPL